MQRLQMDHPQEGLPEVGYTECEFWEYHAIDSTYVLSKC